jgi:hypothetical protein
MHAGGGRPASRLPGSTRARTSTCERPSSGLRDLGYVEGRNVVIEYRSAEGKIERLPALAAELCARLMSRDGRRHTHRPGRQASDEDPPHRLHFCDRSGHGRARHQPCAPGRQCHGTVQPRPGAHRQVSGAAQAGCSGSQSGRGPVAARCRRGAHGPGHAAGSRSRSAGAGGAASIRQGARFCGFDRAFRWTARHGAQARWRCGEAPSSTASDGAWWTCRQRTGCRR